MSGPHTQAWPRLSCAQGSVAPFETGLYRPGSLGIASQTGRRPGTPVLSLCGFGQTLDLSERLPPPLALSPLGAERVLRDKAV